ncbi:choice-of-anchor M domain-containing protein [uncultured Actinomyces sp.]|uniref:choice-of-anchor M domain-containing protein n=1 Tax=uncultured Actinomyces sp. TaxID=249061 RepID=UPI0025D3D809|nr:choice-of-anchor M domain-containing protein [uncultured Actinomyces sp.]
MILIMRVKRIISTGALALTIALMPQLAWAGPDRDAEWVVTGQHVDAPIPIWHADTHSFTMNTINMPMEKTVLWLPKAWAGSGAQEAKYQLEIPEKRPDLAFLGPEHSVLNAAPQNPGPNNTPIWAGLGADSSVEWAAPDEFDGSTYTLDLINVDGPGRMEMFIDHGDSVSRFLSSHDIAYRSVYNPRHTHLFTTFTQPGRYQARFRVNARSIDGKTIYTSPIQSLTWQVGGSNPSSGSITDIHQAFAAAQAQRSDGVQAQPSLTLAPNSQREHPGDQHLTEITFNSGHSTDRGRLWLTVNGYFLTEEPVVDGKAQVRELLGDDDALVQAVFIPEAGSGSARWASTPQAFSQRDRAQVRVTRASSVIIEPSNPDPSPVWDPAQISVSRPGVHVSYIRKEGSEDQYTVQVQADDPELRAAYKVEFFESEYDFSPWCAIEGTLGKGGIDIQQQDLGACMGQPMYMKFSVRPHPKSLASMTTKAQEDVELSSSFGMDLKLKMWPGGSPAEPAPAPTSEPLLPSPAPTPSPAPNIPDTSNDHAADALKTNPVELARGHMDLRLRVDSGAPTNYSLVLKDDSLTGEKTSVMRAIDSVTWKVGVNARFTRPQSLSDPSYDVLGAIGESSYVLPETQNPDIVWPGVSTEGIDYSQFPKGIDYELKVVESPKDSRVSFFQGGTFGGPANIMVDSADPAKSLIHTDSPTHMHANWVFSRPGHYRLQIRALDGDKEIAAPVSWNVSVHEAAVPTPAPSSEQPSEQPIPSPSPSVDTPSVAPAPTPDQTSAPTPASTESAPTPAASPSAADPKLSETPAAQPDAQTTTTPPSNTLGQVSAGERLLGSRSNSSGSRRVLGGVSGGGGAVPLAASAEPTSTPTVSESPAADSDSAAQAAQLSNDEAGESTVSQVPRWWWIPAAALAIVLGAGAALLIRRRH